MSKIFHTLKGGYDSNFGYIVGHSDSDELAIIDAAIDYGEIKTVLDKYPDKKLTKILLTHAHFDHIVSLLDIIEQTGAELIAHPDAKAALSKQVNIKYYTTVNNNDIINVSGQKLKVIHTPGHQVECICFEWVGENILFTGDTLFIGACGRCDLPGANPSAQYRSLRYIYDNLDENLRLYPGHDYGHKPHDILKNEKVNNIYLNLFGDKSLNDAECERTWLRTRMG